MTEVIDRVRTRPAAPRVSCHGVVAGGAGSGAPVIALAGAPNVGKSTLFNALTGARVTMGNWPGTTVNVSRGRWHADGTGGRCSCPARCCGTGACSCGRDAHDLTLIDLPGAYSLESVSPDQTLTRELLADVPASQAPHVTVVVVDSAHLARGLYLVAQLRELRLRLVIALTMTDVATRHGLTINTAMLAQRLGVPVVAVDPRRRAGLDDLTRAVQDTLETEVPAARPLGPVAVDDPDPDLAREDERFAFVEDAVAGSIADTGSGRATASDRIDRWVTAPVVGPLAFLAVMWLVFQITTTAAAPLQSVLDQLFNGPVAGGVRALLGAVGLGGGWIEGLLVDGLITGVGMVLTFVPLMGLMFVLLALLEDSGYLARAAVVTDKLMRTVGLPGSAFLPLVVGFGCNVPAIAATRILPGARQRLLTALLVPFTSCSARLTVYVMIGTTFFGRWAGTVVFGLYLTSILLVIGVGMALRQTLWRTMGAEPLVLDLPPYQRPTLRLTLSVAWTRLQGFLRTAGGIIVAAVVAVWLLASIPAAGGHAFGQVPVEDSVYGVAAQAITPVLGPTGFASWQTTSALAVGFVAKEAVISSWAQTYAVGQPADGAGSGQLGEAIATSFAQSSGGHPLAAVLAFLVFLLAYTPCVATLAAQKREIGLRWTLFGVGMQLTVAYTAAVLVFQVLRLFL